MRRNAVTIALSNPDILHHILSLDLLSQSDLRSSCLVSQEWAAAGLILLWRYPQCHTMHSFRLLLDTLRHEVDLSGPLASSLVTSLSATPSSPSSEGAAVVAAANVLRRAATMRTEKKPSMFSSSSTSTSSTSSSSTIVSTRPLLHTPTSFSLLPTPYRPHQRHKEYGIPFHGQRIFHRAQFIRKIDFCALAGFLSLHHLEILARSCKIGFRSLDLQTIRLPFSDHLLDILMNSMALKQLSLGHIHIPTEALVCLESCFSGLTEFRLFNCPDSMGDTELGMTLRHCTQLKLLEIHGESFTDESLVWISKACVNLETLVIEAPKMTDAVVGQIALSCTKLRSWSLIDCTALQDETIMAIEKMYFVEPPTTLLLPFASLRITADNNNSSSSALSTTTATYSASSSAVSSPLTSTSTSFTGSPSDSESLPKYSISHQDQHPPSRSFAMDRYTSTLGDSVTRSGMLSKLEFRHCTHIKPQHINVFLRSQSKLEHLVLGGISITDEALVAMTEMPFTHLQSLALHDCSEISDETMVAVLFNCEQMTKLTISGSNFTLRTFSSISLHLQNLEELRLEHVPLIMNESIQEILTRCTRLRSLKLWHCRNLTQDLFMDQSTPCPGLEELEYMDKFVRPYADDGWATQVLFLRSLVTRFEGLKILRLAKLADTFVPVNLVSYLCQLDQLEQFTILYKPSLDLRDLKELQTSLPTLVHLGLGTSDILSEEDVLVFNQSHHRPSVRIYKRMLESIDELQDYDT
ncbi:hypothetical protein BG011_004509 [Mortierella polycephala]|uniref:RNI-like protein n=1 Tax=Mortierella polycephala TaxID=41804 RepID=A0A9P6QFG3_9FUNG|nr:hypothetical protein BG011_004509 [Mortierella polycephala]